MKLSFAAIRRRGFTVAAFTVLAVLSSQVQAQSCNGTPTLTLDPGAQTVPKSIPGTPTVVQLTGTTNKTGAAYSWRQLPIAPATAPAAVVTLSNSAISNPTFVAPSTGPMVLRFQLTARCSTGVDAVKTTDINITDVVTNSPPTALATASPESAREGQQVTLDGRPSYDIDAGTTLTYGWVQTGVGPTSPAVVLTATPAGPGVPAGSIVTFSAPNTPISTGAVLTFRLTVSDGVLTGSTDKNVNIIWTNDPPVASLECPAGGVIIVNEGAPVTLDGSGSHDADGSIVSYRWSQAVGLPTLGVASYSTPSINFNAPNLGFNQLGSLTLTLTVTDNEGATDDAVCSVYINDVTAPVIRVPDNATVEADFAGGKAYSYNVSAFDAVDNQEAYALACTPPSSSDFPLAAAPDNARTTDVSCEATDSAGNRSQAGFSVTVRDTTPPVMTLPTSFALEATGPDGATADFAAATSAIDAVDGTRAVSCAPASGETFALGSSGTLVTCNSSDSRNNAAAPAGFTVTVHDTTDPVVTAPADTEFEATALLTPLNQDDYGSATASDLVGVATLTDDAPEAFPLGDTRITWTATDASGNSGTASTKVTVLDRTPPSITAPANQTFEATAPMSMLTVADYGKATATDAVGVDPVASDAPLMFPVGDTTINWTATDTSGNVARATTVITIADTTAPVVTAPGDVTVEATGAETVVSHGNATATDAVGVVSLVSNAPATFPVGTTTIVWTATDFAGNSNTATSKVTVRDTTAPAVNVPSDVTVEATGPQTVVSHGNATATDAVGVVASGSDAPATFPVGTTTITWWATDAAGNRGTGNSRVTVRDTTAPVMTQVATIVVTASANSQATVLFPQIDASDAVGVTSLVCRDTAGRTLIPGQNYAFNVGNTAVTCTALDHAANSGTMGFTVSVGYAWNGFFKPVDMAPIVNSSKAGSASPLKFSLGGNQGMAIMAAGFPKSAPMSCSGAVEDPLLETVTAGSSSLSFDATSGQYHYVWKSEKSWAGSCRQLQVKLIDGTSHTANFMFK